MALLMLERFLHHLSVVFKYFMVVFCFVRSILWSLLVLPQRKAEGCRGGRHRSRPVEVQRAAADRQHLPRGERYQRSPPVVSAFF